MKKTFSDAACASCAVGQFVVGDCLGGPKFGGDFGFRGEHDKPKTSMGVGVASLPSGLLHFEPQKDEGLVQIFVSFPKCFFFPGGSILGFQGVPTCPFRHRFTANFTKTDSPGPLVFFFVFWIVYTKNCFGTCRASTVVN